MNLKKKIKFYKVQLIKIEKQLKKLKIYISQVPIL